MTLVFKLSLAGALSEKVNPVADLFLANEFKQAAPSATTVNRVRMIFTIRFIRQWEKVAGFEISNFGAQNVRFGLEK